MHFLRELIMNVSKEYMRNVSILLYCVSISPVMTVVSRCDEALWR